MVAVALLTAFDVAEIGQPAFFLVATGISIALALVATLIVRMSVRLVRSEQER